MFRQETVSLKEIEGEKRKKEMKNEEIIDLIEGYAFPITTPFGKVLSLSADLLTAGRPLRNIEANIEKFIRPFAEYTYRRVALGEKARSYSKKSVAELLHVSSETHEIVFLHPNAEMDPFRRVTAIFLEALTKEKAGSKIQVYLQTNQSYVNVMPWLQNPERIKVVTLESDDTGSLGTNTIVSAVLKNASKARFNVIQLQALSSKTKQKLDLQAFQAQIEALRIEYPNIAFACVIDATPLISGSGYSKKEIDDALNFFDFSIIQVGRLLGGSLAASIMVCKKAKLTKLQVKLSSADLSEEIEPTSVLRASHLLEFYYSQGLPQRIESSQNTQLFFDEVQKVNQRLRETSVLNKIELGGIKAAAPAGRYSIMILNEGSQDFLEEEFKGYPVILAKHLAQILNDLFGIQVKASNMLHSKQLRFRFSDISPAAITKYGLTPETGNVELNASTIELDIHFLLTQDEIMYIISALEQIALGSGKLIKYYNKKLLKPKMFIPQQVNVSLAACSSFPYVETDISNREEQYAKQLYESSRILKQPANYFTISENWSEEKSTVFPLNALADSFPLKERKVNVTNVDNDVDSDDSTPSLILPNIPKKVVVVNSKAVQEARNLILRIQTYGPDTPKNNLKKKPQEEELRRESIQLPEEGQAQMSQEYLEQLREQIKRELRGELREEVELEIKEKQEKEAAELAAAKKKDAKFAMNEQIQAKEKRLRNLKAIFLFYSSLPDFLEERQELSEKDQAIAKAPIPFSLRKQAQQESIHRLGLNKFFKFCDDFELISEQLDLKTLYKLFTKVCPHSEVSNVKPSKSTSSSQQLQSMLKSPQAIPSPSTTATGASTSATQKANSKTVNTSDISENNKISLAYPGELQFNQFSLVIDKMAQVFYAKNDNLYTQFDKIDQFHKHLGLDDKRNYRHRLKAEGLVNFSFLFHDKYQLFTTLPAHIRNSSVAQSIMQKPKFNMIKQSKFSASSSQNDLENPKQTKIDQKSQQSWQYQEQYPSNSSFSSQQSSLFMREAQLAKNSNRKFEDLIGDTNIYVSQLNPQNTMSNNNSKITKNSSLNQLPSLNSLPNVPHIGMMREVEWRQDQNSMNPKLLYNDPTISQQDILTELTQIQQTKKPSQQRVQSQPPLEAAAKSTPNDIYKNEQLFASPFRAKNTVKTDFVTPGNNPGNNNKNILNNSNSSMPNVGHSFPNIQHSQFQQLNSPKLSSKDIVNSAGIHQADIRKQQVLSRAKHLSILGKEKERDHLRLHTSEGDFSPSENQPKNNKIDTSILLAKQNQAIHSPAIYSNLQKK